jgi:hypothetical protein
MWRARLVTSETELDAIRHALAVLERRLTVAGPVDVARHVGRLLGHWNARNAMDGEKEMELEDWVDDLADYAEAHIAAACREWRRTQHFKPKVGDIVPLIEAERARDRESRRRCRVLLGMETPRPWERMEQTEQPVTDRPALEMMASVARKLTGKAE